ncbi:MAG: hypothetical protein KAI47_20110, partial [Deltaproteobacteria bacterium]|nr:hypothetical protein [Deltaproteobacteria bacterium]
MATKTCAFFALSLLLAACPGHSSGHASDPDQKIAPPADLTDSNTENSSGEALCSSQTCPGCCLSSGECVTTTTNTICGQGGASCVDCTTFGTTCIAGTCQGCVASCEAKPCGSSDGCGGVCQAGSGCIPPCTPVCTGKTCGSSDGCGDTCKTGSGCVPPCTPACTGKTCGVPDGCGGTCKAGSGCVAACIPDCNVSCGASDGCGG